MAKTGVYLPTSGRSQLVPRALSSLISQTTPDWQCVVGIDGSNLETEKVVARFCELDKRISMFVNKNPIGAPATRNRAVSQMDTLFITGLDDDDAFLPNRIELFEKEFSDKYAFLSANDIMINDTGKSLRSRRPTHCDLPKISVRNFVGNQAFFLRSRFELVGGFDENFPSLQDHELWFRMIEQFGPSRCIRTASQIIFSESSRSRITTSVRHANSIDLFIQKHGEKMTTRGKNAFLFRKSIFEKSRPNFRQLVSASSLSVDFLRELKSILFLNN